MQSAINPLRTAVGGARGESEREKLQHIDPPCLLISSLGAFGHLEAGAEKEIAATKRNWSPEQTIDGFRLFLARRNRLCEVLSLAAARDSERKRCLDRRHRAAGTAAEKLVMQFKSFRQIISPRVSGLRFRFSPVARLCARSAPMIHPKRQVAHILFAFECTFSPFILVNSTGQRRAQALARAHVDRERTRSENIRRTRREMKCERANAMAGIKNK